MFQPTRSQTPDSKQRTGFNSVAKTAETVNYQSHSKRSAIFESGNKRPKSPLPIDVEVIDDYPAAFKDSAALTILDILNVGVPQPVRQKNWTLQLSQDAEQFYQQTAPLRLELPRAQKGLINPALRSSDIFSRSDSSDRLGKRSANSPSPKRNRTASETIDDIKTGVDRGLVQWSSLTFNPATVNYFKSVAPKLLKK